MGLFSRTNADANGQEDFDDIDLPSSEDLKGGLFTSEEPEPAPVAQTKRPQTPVSPSRSGYGIEDAIKLMRTLPRDNNEVVVTVVKKTLESTLIKVPDIVADANQKESRIRNQHKNLEGEIKELQEQIAQRNQQISDLLEDLKETTDVRQRLQLAMELDGETVAAPEKPQANPVASPPQNQSTPANQTNSAVSSNQHPSNPNRGNGDDSQAMPATAIDASNGQSMRRRAQQRTNPPH